jgi:hypothetical protein
MDNQQEFKPGSIKFERRKFKRISRNYVISYVPIKSEDLKYDLSQTKNLSEGGLLFISDRKFEKDIILKIKLRLPQFTDYVIVQAQVIDSIQVGTGTMCKTRVKFIDVDQKIKEAIRNLVDHG